MCYSLFFEHTTPYGFTPWKHALGDAPLLWGPEQDKTFIIPTKCKHAAMATSASPKEEAFIVQF